MPAFPDLCAVLRQGGTVRCFLSDANGIPLNPLDTDSITCMEVVDGDGVRKPVHVTLPDGEQATLQEVTILKQGYIVLEVIGQTLRCRSEPIPFSTFESVLLCAPSGTAVQCHVTEFLCEVSVNCVNNVFTSVDILLDICQSIQSVADTVIEVPVSFCSPREAIERTGRRQLLPPPSCAIRTDGIDKLPKKEALPQCHDPIQPDETACLSVSKVYDWILNEKKLSVRVESGDLVFNCADCTIDLFVPAAIVCERTISGNLHCDDTPVSGALVTFLATPNVVSINPVQAITDADGNFSTVVTVPPETSETSVIITATAETVTASLPTKVLCFADDCRIEIFATEPVTCNGSLQGRVSCGNQVIEGAVVTLTSSPNVLSFNPDPATTGFSGNFFSAIQVPEGLPSQLVTITATTTVEGETVTDSVTILAGCPDPACTIDFITPPSPIVCTGIIEGFITCGGVPVNGANFLFTSLPSIVSFNPNPATSNATGYFQTVVTVPLGTPTTSINITATAPTPEGIAQANLGVQVQCPGEECPCKMRLGIDGNKAPAVVALTQNWFPSTLEGTINITALQCFTDASICNPAVNNFNITFDSGGTSINFVQGRRGIISCEDGNVARIQGTAIATGDLFSGLFDVFIQLSIDPSNIGTWTIIAMDHAGDSFTTTFSAPMSPTAFIGACSEKP